MNILPLFLADLRKLRRSLVWPLILILPLGANAAMVLDMDLRYESYLYPRAVERGLTSWQVLLVEHHHILMWGAFLPLFVALISALVYYVEQRHDGWRAMLSLPLPRAEIYLAKWLTIVFFSAVLLGLDSAGLMLVGKLFGFPEPLPWGLFARSAGFQFAAVLAVAALHNWLSARYLRSLVTPVVIGFGGVMVAYTLYYNDTQSLARFFAYAYTIFGGEPRGELPWVALWGGLTGSALFLLAGWVEFRKRDVV